MWFKRKTELEKQILEYGHNTDVLLEFAAITRLKRIQDICRDDLKRAYKELVEAQASMYYRIEYLKYINKFMKAHGVPFILKIDEVLEITPNDAIIESMSKVSKNNPTKKTARNNKIVFLKDNKGWSFSQIAAEFKLKSKATVHEIYWREKKRLELSTG